MTLRVRPTVDSDLPAVTAIYADAVLHGTASFELEPPREGEMARRRAVLLDGGYPYLAAEREGVVVGYAYAGPYRPRAAYRSTVEDSIYVAPRARGQGIGRALLGALIDRMRGARFPAHGGGDRRRGLERFDSPAPEPRLRARPGSCPGSATSTAAGSLRCSCTAGSALGPRRRRRVRWPCDPACEAVLARRIERLPVRRRGGAQAFRQRGQDTTRIGRSMARRTCRRSCPRLRVRPVPATTA